MFKCSYIKTRFRVAKRHARFELKYMWFYYSHAPSLGTSISIIHLHCPLILSPIIIQLENFSSSPLMPSLSYLLFQLLHNLSNWLFLFILDYCGRPLNIPFHFCAYKHPLPPPPPHVNAYIQFSKARTSTTTVCYFVKNFVEGIKLRILK